ncbi:MAG: hypothetical protein MK082_02915 [Phycisphaerales bacterium]|nr:hypothetical protein [Phycisphaerales bacterium]
MAVSTQRHNLPVMALFLLGFGAGASAELFQFDMELQSIGIDGAGDPVLFSALVLGVDDSDPDEPWESFTLSDSGPWELTTSNPMLTLSGSQLSLAYGPTFGWGGMTLEITDLIGPDVTVDLDWTLTGPEWNHDSISGEGSGQVIFPDGSSETLLVNSWTVTMVPAPGAVPVLFLLPGIVRRRRC